ncbi:hypothetical protein ACLKA6_007090 [Drosophila palustris]
MNQKSQCKLEQQQKEPGMDSGGIGIGWLDAASAKVGATGAGRRDQRKKKTKEMEEEEEEEEQLAASACNHLECLLKCSVAYT